MTLGNPSPSQPSPSKRPRQGHWRKPSSLQIIDTSTVIGGGDPNQDLDMSRYLLDPIAANGILESGKGKGKKGSCRSLSKNIVGKYPENMENNVFLEDEFLANFGEKERLGWYQNPEVVYPKPDIFRFVPDNASIYSPSGLGEPSYYPEEDEGKLCC